MEPVGKSLTIQCKNKRKIEKNYTLDHCVLVIAKYSLFQFASKARKALNPVAKESDIPSFLLLTPQGVQQFASLRKTLEDKHRIGDYHRRTKPANKTVDSVS